MTRLTLLLEIEESEPKETSSRWWNSYEVIEVLRFVLIL